jgi:hypothetical protein
MGNTPICSISAAGIERPTLGAILEYFVSGYQGIYGSDTYLGSDAQDGELLGLFSVAIDDVNAGIVSSYNAYSPTTAQGAGLSSIIKTNGMARKAPSYSTVTVAIVGVAYTPIPNGVITDEAGNDWALPASVTIPAAGVINVTATCTVAGAISVSVGATFSISLEAIGWQSATAVAAASLGLPVENDAQLRQRQSLSTGGPSMSTLAGIVGNILAISTVTSCQGYENDTDSPDANGIPGRAMAFVVAGGDAPSIARAIGASKSPGSNTYGTVGGTYVDPYGIGHAINWFAPTLVPIYPSIRIRALSGYTVDVGVQIQKAVSAYINGLGAGVSLLTNRLNVPANLNGAPASLKYEILSLAVARANAAASTADVSAKFTDLFTCTPDSVKITVALA